MNGRLGIRRVAIHKGSEARKRDGWIRRGTDSYRQPDELLSTVIQSDRESWVANKTRGIGGYVKGWVARYCRGMRV
jgi:hypothetical protein